MKTLSLLNTFSVITREQFEAWLDAGQLQTCIQYAKEVKWYDCRRNGATQTWKRDPQRFEIPVKFRLRDTMRVKSEHFINGKVDFWFRKKPEASGLEIFTEILNGKR